jgi:hypothetical protein
VSLKLSYNDKIMSTTVRTEKFLTRKMREKTEKEEYSTKIEIMEEFAVS